MNSFKIFDSSGVGESNSFRIFNSSGVEELNSFKFFDSSGVEEFNSSKFSTPFFNSQLRSWRSNPNSGVRSPKSENNNQRDLQGNLHNLKLHFPTAKKPASVNLIKTGPLELSAPKFLQSSYNLKISETTVIGSVIGKISAKTSNNDNNLYYILDSVSSIFGVHPNTGDVILTGKLSYKTQKEHVIRVKVLDRALQYLPNDKFREADKEKLSQNSVIVTIQIQPVSNLNFQKSGFLSFDLNPNLQSNDVYNKMLHYGVVKLINLSNANQHQFSGIEISQQNIPDFVRLSPISKGGNSKKNENSYDVILDLDLLQQKNVNAINSRSFAVFRAINSENPQNNNLPGQSLRISIQLDQILPSKKPKFSDNKLVKSIRIENYSVANQKLAKLQAISYDLSSSFLRYQLYSVRRSDYSYLELDRLFQSIQEEEKNQDQDQKQKISNQITNLILNSKTNVLNKEILVDKQGNLMLADQDFIDLNSLKIKLMEEFQLFLVVSDTRFAHDPNKKTSLRLDFTFADYLQPPRPVFQLCASSSLSESSSKKSEIPLICELKKDLTNQEMTENSPIIEKITQNMLPRNAKSLPRSCTFYRKCDFNIPFKQCSFAYYGSKNCQTYFTENIFNPEITLDCKNSNSEESKITAESNQENDIIRYSCLNCIDSDIEINSKTGKFNYGTTGPVMIHFQAQSMLYPNAKSTCRIKNKFNNFDYISKVPVWDDDLIFGTFSPIYLEVGEDRQKQGSVLLNLKAAGSSVSYEFFDQDQHQYQQEIFKIENSNLMYADDFDPEIQRVTDKTYDLKIIAKNSDFSSKILFLTILLPKTVDSFPKLYFTNGNYNYKVDEDLPPGSIIGILDTSVSPSKYDLRYSIEPISGSLSIDDRTGILTLQRRTNNNQITDLLDYEARPVEHFRVRVRYGNLAYSRYGGIANCNVSLIISDQPENSYITPDVPTSMKTYVDEGHSINSRINLRPNPEIAALVKNRQPYLKYSYHLLAGTGLKTFNIDKNTGLLKLTKKLNFEARKNYELQVAICAMGSILYCNNIWLIIDVRPKARSDLKAIFVRDQPFFSVGFVDEEQRLPIEIGKFDLFQNQYRPAPRNCLIKNSANNAFTLNNDLQLFYHPNKDLEDSSFKKYIPKELKIQCNQNLFVSATVIRLPNIANQKFTGIQAANEIYQIELPCSLRPFGFRVPVKELSDLKEVFKIINVNRLRRKPTLNPATGHLVTPSCGIFDYEIQLKGVESSPIEFKISYKIPTISSRAEPDFQYELVTPMQNNIIARLQCLNSNNNCQYTLDPRTPAIFQICNNDQICVRRFNWYLQDFGVYKIDVIVGSMTSTKTKLRTIEVKLEDRSKFVPVLKQNQIMKISDDQTGVVTNIGTVGDVLSDAVASSPGSYSNIPMQTHGKIPYNWYQLKITKIVPKSATELFEIDKFNRLVLKSSVEDLIRSKKSTSNPLPNIEKIYIWILAENSLRKNNKDSTMISVSVNYQKKLAPEFISNLKNLGSSVPYKNQIYRLPISKEVSVGYCLSQHWFKLPFPPAIDNDFDDLITYQLKLTSASVAGSMTLSQNGNSYGLGLVSGSSSSSSSSWEGKFDIHPSLGYLYVKQDISNLLGARILEIKACDSSNKCAKPSARVQIIILNSNDNSDSSDYNLVNNPVVNFSDEEVLELDQNLVEKGIEVVENTRPGQEIGNVNHVFRNFMIRNVNSGITFKFDNQKKTDADYDYENDILHFSINHFTGIITLKKSIDSELQHTYHLPILANFNNLHSAFILKIKIIDANDFTPSFDKNYFEVNKNENFIITVSDNDISAYNSDVTLRIEHGIDEEQIVEKNWYQANYDNVSNQFLVETSKFKVGQGIFRISACDSGNRCAVQPAILLLLKATEQSQVTNEIFDEENTEFECGIFLPIAKSSKICLISISDIEDQEINSQFEIKDGWLINTQNINLPGQLYSRTLNFAENTVNLKILNTNQCKLKITTNTQNIQIFENSTPVQAIFSIVATSQEQTVVPMSVRYRILNDNRLAIHPTRGEVRIIEEFDREEDGDNVKIVILAEIAKNMNGGLWQGLLISPTNQQSYYEKNFVQIIVNLNILDDNDNAPEFLNLPYNARILIGEEATRIGSTIIQIQAKDLDQNVNSNAKVTYEFDNLDAKNNLYSWLDLNKNTGIVSLKENVPLSMPGNSTIKLRIKASDNAFRNPLSSFAELSLTVLNKIVPVFSQSKYKCQGNVETLNVVCDHQIFARAGGANSVGTGGVSDVIYLKSQDLKSENSKNSIFKLNPVTGKLTFTDDFNILQTFLPIATLQETNYNFKISAVDKSQPQAKNHATVEVTIPPNYNGIEIFNQRVYEIDLRIRSVYSVDVKEIVPATFLDSGVVEVKINRPVGGRFRNVGVRVSRVYGRKRYKVEIDQFLVGLGIYYFSTSFFSFHGFTTNFK